MKNVKLFDILRYIKMNVLHLIPRLKRNIFRNKYKKSNAPGKKYFEYYSIRSFMYYQEIVVK